MAVPFSKMDQDTSSSPPAIQDEGSVTSTKPPWTGWIKTTGDALLILEAARRGMIPRVTRRLVDSERKMISSGSVFVFDEDESGIKRWTDGFYWSPSRILGNFLVRSRFLSMGFQSQRPIRLLYVHICTNTLFSFTEKLTRRIIFVELNVLKLQPAIPLLYWLMKVLHPNGMNPPRCPGPRTQMAAIWIGSVNELCLAV